MDSLFIVKIQLLYPTITILWCDNLRTTYLYVNLIFHTRTKHVKVGYHFIHNRVAKMEIHFQFISLKD